MVLAEIDLLGHNVLLIMALSTTTHVLVLLLIPWSDLEGVSTIRDTVAVVIVIIVVWVELIHLLLL